MNHKSYFAAAALFLFALITQWQLWRLQHHNAQLNNDLSYLQSELTWLRKHEMLNTVGSADESHPDDEMLERALDRLGDKNILHRYQASQTVKRFGQQAVPELLELIAAGHDRQRQSALLLLHDMRPATAAPRLRQYVAAQLAADSTDSQQWKSADLASAMAILVRLPDPQALSLFEQSLDHADAEVRAAGMAGISKLGSLRSVPLLAQRLGQESSVVERQLHTCLRQLCRQDPGEFSRAVATLSPRQRFLISTALGDDSSVAARDVLRALSQDTDPRVALSAARQLTRRGDTAVRDSVHELAKNLPAGELRQLAEQLLREQ